MFHKHTPLDGDTFYCEEKIFETMALKTKIKKDIIVINIWKCFIYTLYYSTNFFFINAFFIVSLNMLFLLQKIGDFLKENYWENFNNPKLVLGPVVGTKRSFSPSHGFYNRWLPRTRCSRAQKSGTFPKSILNLRLLSV